MPVTIKKCSAYVFCGWLSFCAPVLAAEAAPDFTNFTAQANTYLKQMTLDEKIGQMTLPTIKFLLQDGGLQLISLYQLGGVLAVDDSGLAGKDFLLADWQALAKQIKSYPVTIAHGNISVPLFLGTDAVHGNQHIAQAVLFPHNIGLGATHDPALIEQIGAWTAYDVKDSGFNWGYAPCVAVAQDYRWGRTYESFGLDPQWVAKLGAAYVRGNQAAQNGHLTGILANAKHYIGDGATNYGIDEGNVILTDKEKFLQINSPGYVSTAQQGVGSIMVSYNSINDVPMTLNKKYLDLIRDGNLPGQEQPYTGFLVSDFEAVARIARDRHLGFADTLATAVNSGLDMFMISRENPQFYATIGDFQKVLRKDIKDGLIPMARIDDAVRRILQVKIAMGMMQSSAPALAKPQEAEVAVATRAAQESFVLLKNDNHTLPYRSAAIKHVILLGDATDDIGTQCGGWTLVWQGVKGNKYWQNDAKASSIKSGIAAILKKHADYITNPDLNDLQQKLADGVYTAKNTLVVATLSEVPYAEFMGDVGNKNRLYDPTMNTSMPAQQAESLIIKFPVAERKQIEAVQQHDIPVTTVLFSGRPLIITQDGSGQSSPIAPLTLSDAFIAAWLPGTTGGTAIADALFGKYHFRHAKLANTLPFAWPRSMAQLGKLSCHPSDGDAKVTPLFPCLYGLQD